MSRLTARQFADLTRKTTPLAAVFGLEVEALEAGKARVRLPFRSDFVRAGGTVSGPAMMMLADYALYAVIMSVAELGEGAVTSNLNTTFLRRPGPARRDRRSPPDPLRQAACLRGGDDIFRGRDRAGGACDRDLCFAASETPVKSRA